MSRAIKISEDVKRQTGRTVYRCMNNSCQNMEPSTDMTPSDLMRGHGTACSQCGSQTEAVWSAATLPGAINQPTMSKVSR
jgi:DNA-directed RNA polymerase subunit RPC12/RpoP